MKILIEKVRENPICIVLMNILIFICLYLIITSTLWLGTILIIITFFAILYLQKRELLEVIFEIYSKHKKVAWISLIVLLIILPFTFFEDSYFFHISVIACFYSIVALGLNMQLSTNMVNFAPAVFLVQVPTLLQFWRLNLELIPGYLLF